MDPYSDDPYDCLGVSEDASETEVRVAAAKAKSKFNPDNYADDKKDEARLKVYRVRAAEEAISGSGTYPPDDELTTKTGGDGGDDTTSGTESSRGSETDSDGGDATDGGDKDSNDKTETSPDSKPEPEPIEVGVSESTPSVGETITVTADVNGDPLPKGAVKIESERIATIRDGSAKVSVDTPGDHTLRISNSDSGTDVEPGTQTINVQPLDRSVSMLCDPSDVGTDEEVRIEVRYEDGTRVANGTIETSRGHSIPLKRGGAELTFEEPGEVTVEPVVNESSDSDTVSSATISVSETELRLTLEPINPTVSQGESVTFTVRDENGERVRGATISNPRTTATTDTTGQATLTFETAGTQTVTTEKPDDSITYQKTTTEVTIEPAEIELALEVIGGDVSIGETVRGTVWTENGSRASGVVVSCSHEESGSERMTETDETGEIRFELDQQGTYEITAGDESADTPYIADSKTITVSPESLGLTVIPARTEAAVGEQIRFTVRDSRGHRVKAAQVHANGQDTKTDSRGVGALQFDSPGEFEVTATKDHDTIEFEPGNTEVTIYE
jgi:plastocyanin